MKTIDNTNGKRPRDGQEFAMTVEFGNGSRYVYYGATKRECREKFTRKWGTLHGFVKLEWDLG